MRIKQVVLALLVSAAAIGLHAQSNDSSGTKPDNTRVNKQDRATGAPTADQQKDNRSDLDVTKNIRRSLMEDKSLSTYAHNVKIITQNGTVTLKGPVKSDEEKKSILSKATSVVGGSDKVIDQMSVKQ